MAAGSATVAGEGSSRVSITQLSNTAIIDWNTFSIGRGESTTFLQPSTQSAVLNRVLGGSTSLIDGTLTANGQVYLINGNGIVVSKSGMVSTGGFIASTQDVAPDFSFSHLHFSGTSSAGVNNAGTISAANGSVYLIGATVANTGEISAPNGTAGLAAGREVLIGQDTGNGTVAVVAPAANASVSNTGAIRAAAAELRAANGNIYALAVNNGGTIRATTAARQGGRIWLTADGGISNAGTLDASASARGGQGGHVTVKSSGGTASDSGAILAMGGWRGQGGSAELSGQQVGFEGKINLTAPSGKTGDFLLDPTTLEIEHQTGGPYPITDTTNATVSDSAVSTALATADVFLEADSAIEMDGNAAISWTTTNSLNFDTTGGNSSSIALAGSIVGTKGTLALLTVNAGDPITETGSVNVASFDLIGGSWSQVVGQSYATYLLGVAKSGLMTKLPSFTATDFVAEQDVEGSTFLRASGGRGTVLDPYSLTDVYGLQGVATTLSSDFILANNIVASGTAEWGGTPNTNPPVPPVGFSPIGTSAQAYSGIFNGAGFTVSGLTLTPAAGVSDYGLFGQSSGIIEDLKLTGLTVKLSGGDQSVGGLVGLNNGLISNVSVAGTLTIAGPNTVSVGGMAGQNAGNIINDCTSAMAVSGAASDVGGLVGTNTGNITDSHASGAVSGDGTEMGGLVGLSSGSVSDSYASGAVTGGNDDEGGLAGQSTGLIQDCSSSGAVTSNATIFSNGGGLVGANGGVIEASSSTGVVTASVISQYIGGLVGRNFLASSSILDGCFSTGAIRLAGAVSVAPGAIFICSEVGGLVGGNDSGLVADSSSSSSITVSGTTNSTPVSVGDIGGFIGDSVGTVQNCSSTGGITVTGTGLNGKLTSIGGFAGVTLGVLANDHSTGKVTVGAFASNVGGFVGRNEGSTESSSSSSSVTAGVSAKQIGGFAGENEYGTISGSVSSGAVSTGDSASSVGGLVGSNLVSPSSTVSIDSSSSSSSVTVGNSATYVGGLVGQSTAGIIQDSFATGAVKGGNTATSFGGLIGDSAAQVENAHATGAVSVGTGATSIGGLVGSNDGSGAPISQSYASGAITAGNNPEQIGGLVGSNSGATINLSFSTGAVKVGSSGGNSGEIGGLVGLDFGNATLSSDYSLGNVTAGNSVLDIGGLVGGGNDDTLSSDSAYGAVTGGSSVASVGGLIGDSISTITLSLSSGNVTVGTNSANIGSFIGEVEGGSLDNQSVGTGVVKAGTGSSNVGGQTGS